MEICGLRIDLVNMDYVYLCIIYIYTYYIPNKTIHICVYYSVYILGDGYEIEVVVVETQWILKILCGH